METKFVVKPSQFSNLLLVMWRDGGERYFQYLTRKEVELYENLSVEGTYIHVR